LVGERQAGRLEAGRTSVGEGGRFRAWLDWRAVSGGEIMQGPWGKHVDVPRDRGGWDADRAVAALYGEHYSALVQLASFLVADVARAEQVVQDSFVALHASWRRLRDGESALAYLRQSVLSRSRSVRPRRLLPGQEAPSPGTDGAAAEQDATAGPGSAAVILALRVLPARQREAVVMRYYAGLPDAEIAGILGISERAVRQHAARALGSLRAVLAAGDAAAIPGFGQIRQVTPAVPAGRCVPRARAAR
jgi:RNA polymerase sigma factor (sigma-70 family)